MALYTLIRLLEDIDSLSFLKVVRFYMILVFRVLFHPFKTITTKTNPSSNSVCKEILETENLAWRAKRI